MQPSDERHELFCRFPDAETALAAAIALGFAGDDATELPKDGWLAGPDGNLYYYCIDVCFGTGTIYDADGNIIPGFHINGLWFGPIDQCPDFGASLINPPPSTPAVRFG